MPETLSPLRYPGGKAKISPLIKYIIEHKTDHVNTYIEPFAGGAAVALDLLMSGTVSDIIINDYDKAIYSFWRAVITEPERFVRTIRTTPVTIDEWKKQKEIYTAKSRKYSFELGFATFFLNRTNRSGILSAGPIGGYQQKGNYLIDARFNKEQLIDRITKIATYRKHIKIYNKDIRSFIRIVVVNNQLNSFIYFDPPYYTKGKELYINHLQNDDHFEIYQLIIQAINCPWVMTYDNEQRIANMYQEYTQRLYSLTYSLANKGKSSELIIFSDENLCPSSIELNTNKIKTEIHGDTI